ncbi:MAG: hypothetical protein II821_00255 [Treponema sp.]|jgi:hypothetical protein|nr:hypothetical protein [Treponema sp.]
MKKNIFRAVVIGLAALTLSGCMSMIVDTSSKKEYQSAPGTPEDSVVFYGYIDWDTGHSFSQMNPDFPPDYQKMKSPGFVSKPVAPGSTYVLEQTEGSCVIGNVRWYWDQHYSLQSAATPLIINVPKKPGLYYVGEFDGFNIVKTKTVDDKNSTHYGNTMEQWCVKAALELYRGTAWEEALTKRLEEIEAEKKSGKKGDVKDAK